MDVEMRRGDDPKSCTVTIGALTLVFSYNTCVAFAVDGEGWTICENVWSKTTGKHINQLTPSGRERLPWRDFEKRLAEVVERLKFS